MKSYHHLNNNKVTVARCQMNFQQLDPTLLCKQQDKSLLAEQKQFYSSSQGFHMPAYDSGYFDEQTSESFSNMMKKSKIDRSNIDDTFVTSASEDYDDSMMSLNDLSMQNLRKPMRQKHRRTSKHVSFQN